MDKKLIINADDFGVSPQVNQAVKKCLASKRVTAASMLSVGGCFDEAVEILSEIEHKSSGVHLALTGGFIPAAKESSIPSLLTSGRLINDYISFFLRLVSGKIKIRQVYDELKCQLSKVKDAGVKITHIDGHEHIHMLPAVFDVTLKLAKEFGVKYVRVPVENIRIARYGFSIRNIIRHMALKPFTVGKKKKLLEQGIGCNDAFLGHFHSGGISAEVFEFLLNNLDSGLNEIGVHPAVYSDEFIKNNPWYKNSSKELDVLLDDKWEEIMSSLGIQLVSHDEPYNQL